jgi:hypothetical protein
MFTPVVLAHWFRHWHYTHCPIRGATTDEHNRMVSQWEYFWRLGLGAFPLADKILNSRKVFHIWPGSAEFMRPGGRNFTRHQTPKITHDERLAQVHKVIRQAPAESLMLFRCSTRLCTFDTLYAWEQTGIAPAGIYKQVQGWWQKKYSWACQNTHRHGTAEESYWQSRPAGTLKVAGLIRLGGKLDALRKHRVRSQQAGYDIKWLRPGYFITVLQSIRVAFPDAQIMFFSDGPADREELQQIRKVGFLVHVCDNEYPDLFRVYHTLATADVVVCGNSGFSAVPAYLGDSIVIQPHVSVLPLPGAIIADHTTGRFDKDKLVEQVAQRTKT